MMRRVRTEDIEEVNALCFRSKAVWGYDEAFMEACRNEISIKPVEIETTDITVIEVNGKIVGMAQVRIDGEVAELNKLFVDPSVLKSGIGRRLFGWCMERARAHGRRLMELDADPFAAPFYRKMGMNEIGRSPSGSIPGRFLPRLSIDI